MFGKFLIFLFIAVATVQCQDRVTEDDFNYEEIKKYSDEVEVQLNQMNEMLEEEDMDIELFNGIVDKIKALLQKLKDAITKGLQAGTEKLKQLLSFLEKKAEDLIKDGRLDTETKSLMESLKKLEDKARSKGAESCVEGSESKIQALSQQKRTDMVSCLRELVDSAKAAVANAIKQVTGTWDSFKQLYEDFKKCGSGWTSVVCYGKVAARLGLAVVRIPGQIKEIISVGVSFVTNMGPKLGVCVTTANAELANLGAEYLKTVNDCIDSK